MKYRRPFGDVTEKDNRKFNALESLFNAFQKARIHMPLRTQSKCLYAFAHDYLELGMDEVTDEFLLEVDKICPEYIEKYLPEDMEESESFMQIALVLAKYYDERLQSLLK